MLNLSEIFLSIQGESTYAGLPCIFIRLAGCNLRCNYCDSTYSYEARFTKTATETLIEIEKYDPVKLVEITGGEPLLQEQVYELIELLHEDKYNILLETNGSVNLKQVPDFVIKIVDIKCPGSGEGSSFQTENLQYINAQDEIKFVLSDRNDYDWAKQKITEYNLQNNKIIFSSVFTKLAPKTLAEWIIEDKLNVRMQLQMHKYIWDPEAEGV